MDSYKALILYSVLVDWKRIRRKQWKDERFWSKTRSGFKFPFWLILTVSPWTGSLTTLIYELISVYGWVFLHCLAWQYSGWSAVLIPSKLETTESCEKGSPTWAFIISLGTGNVWNRVSLFRPLRGLMFWDYLSLCPEAAGASQINCLNIPNHWNFLSSSSSSQDPSVFSISLWPTYFHLTNTLYMPKADKLFSLLKIICLKMKGFKQRLTLTKRSSVNSTPGYLLPH